MNLNRQWVTHRMYNCFSWDVVCVADPGMCVCVRACVFCVLEQSVARGRQKSLLTICESNPQCSPYIEEVDVQFH